VRAGLTPKFKDVDNLVGMLTYSMGGPSIDGGAPCEDQRILRYTPPVPEFEVMLIDLEPGETMTLENPGVPAVMIILEGVGTVDEVPVRPGRSYYWPANAPSLELSVAAARKGPLKVAMAHKNLHIDRPTAVNRDDFGNSSRAGTMPASPLPYQGLGPTPEMQLRKTSDTKEWMEHALPTLG
jgi:mannose-6-phosphate isomerase